MASVEARDEALTKALGRYVDNLDSGASRQTTRTVLSWWLRDVLYPNEWDDLDVLDDPDQGALVARRTAQALASRVRDEEDRLSSPASARTYFDIVSGALASLTADGHLKENPARLDSAREPLPADPGNTDTEQFWSPESRETLVSFVDERAREAIDERGRAAVNEVRDRAVVAVVAWTGIRGVEVFRSRHDGRDGRQGLRWRRVNLDEGVMTVLGKSGEFEDVGLPRQCRPALERWASLLDPDPEWPVFPTLHRPTLARVVREELEARGWSGQEVADVLEDDRGWLQRCRDEDIVPPALTVDGARSLVKRLSKEAGALEDGEPLSLHGARRGLGETLYRQSPVAAQEQLRHKSIETTKESYSHIEASKQADVVSELLDRRS
jgi:integrase